MQARWDKALNMDGDAVLPNTKGYIVICADVRERKQARHRNRIKESEI